MSKKKRSRIQNGSVRQQTIAESHISAAALPYAMPVLVFILTVLPFVPSLQNGFVNRDDVANFLDNPYYRGLGWNQLRWMFTTFYVFNYRPLTWVTFGGDYLLWGMNPFGYHLTSLLLHALNALVFYFLALRLLSLTLSAPAASADKILRVAAGFSALIFSIHPLRVQSVAWLSARNHLLSSLFFLWTILCYLRATTDATNSSQRLRWMIAAIILYGLSLLSQPSGIMLPLILWLLDVYPLKRLGHGRGKWFGQAARRIWWEKIPFLVLAFVAGLVGLFVKQGVAFEELGALHRLALALYGLASYGWKTVIPLGLSPIYEVRGNFNPWEWRFLLSGTAVLAFSIVLFAVRHRWPAGLASWIYYALILIPYVGVLVPVLTGSVQTVTLNELEVGADRYSYLACLPWAVLSGAGIVYGWRLWLSQRGGFGAFFLACTPLAAIVVVLMGLTWKQTQVWHDSESLWRQILKANPTSSIAYNNIGNSLLMRGESKEAIGFYRKALEIDPNYADAHFDLATALIQIGELQAAIEQFHAGLVFDPKNPKAHYYLGRGYAKRGQMEEAITQFRESLALAPTQSVVHYDLGTALAMEGHLDEAADHFRQAIVLDADYGEPHHSLGRILGAQGRLQEATEEFQKAVHLRPDFAEAHLSLSQALAMQGKREEAAQHYQEAMRIMKSGAAKLASGEQGPSIEENAR